MATYKTRGVGFPGMGGALMNRDLYFSNARAGTMGYNYNSPVSLKNIINSNPYCNNFGNRFGNKWYTNRFIDTNYNQETGGYSYGAMGPYYATGLGNYPNSMYQQVYFGKRSPVRRRKRKSPVRRKKRKSPVRRRKKIVYCLPKQKKFPVNTKKRCSAALSYARYAKSPCRIARCVNRHCKKYPTVGTHSKLMRRCRVR